VLHRRSEGLTRRLLLPWAPGLRQAAWPGPAPAAAALLWLWRMRARVPALGLALQALRALTRARPL
jgi:hypothetical protein